MKKRIKLEQRILETAVKQSWREYGVDKNKWQYIRAIIVTEDPFQVPVGETSSDILQWMQGTWIVATSAFCKDIDLYERTHNPLRIIRTGNSRKPAPSLTERRYGSDPWAWIKVYSSRNPADWDPGFTRSHEASKQKRKIIAEMLQEGHTRREIALALDMKRENLQAHIAKIKKELDKTTDC